MILELHKQGVPIAAIARQMTMDRKTVRKYTEKGLEAPIYGPREPRPCKLDGFKDYLSQRIAAYPGLSSVRLHREIGGLGYVGCLTQIKDFVRSIRPRKPSAFEHRFETSPGQQAQVDFAEFKVEFETDPGWIRKVWLFSMVLGHSRLLWARYVPHQDLMAVLRSHVQAFTALGGVPREILYDHMRTAVLRDMRQEKGGRHIVYNASLVALACVFRSIVTGHSDLT